MSHNPYVQEVELVFEPYLYLGLYLGLYLDLYLDLYLYLYLDLFEGLDLLFWYRYVVELFL
ncbi:MAG: hypothetical protein MRZ79_11650 [Bacteroidia bacterium]|nr:hypothetical protein [Bacteroidia bacterium]